MNRYVGVAKETFREFGQDDAPRLGAALAYYTMFSIGPLLLIAISMAGIFFGEKAAQGRIGEELGKVLGPQMADALQTMIAAASKPGSGAIATIIGIVTLLFGASGVFGQLKAALNKIWNVEEPEAKGILGFVRRRFLSMAMVLGIGFLLLVMLAFDTMIAAFGRMFADRVPGSEAMLQMLQIAISFGLATVLFAAIFKVLPDIEIEWHDVWTGALLTSLLFVIGKFGLGLYLGKAAVGSAYGAAGSLVVLLVWVYWSAQILFLGAEFTQVWSRTHGSHQGDTSKKEALARVAEAAAPRPQPQTAARPVVATPVHARQSSRGGLMKLAAGGVAGVLPGAILGGLSTITMLLRTGRKLVLPFR